MKKCFSFLMLVAATAMAFSSCTRDNLKESESAGTITSLRIKASSADVKSVFDTPVGNSVASLWTENKDVCFVANNTSDEIITDDCTPVIDLGYGGLFASFEPEFTDLAASGDIYAFSPVGVYNKDASKCVPGFTSCTKVDDTDDAIYLNIAAVQTPLANSVDESAQVLYASASYTSVSDELSMQFHHLLAYGKMTITNFAGGEIKSVILTFPENVNGSSCKFAYKKNSNNLSNLSGKTITLNPDNVENNVFWFTLAPFAGTSGEVKVAVTNTSDETYTKTLTLTAGKPLYFNAGMISEFSVNFNGVNKDGSEVLGTYTRITSMNDLEDGNYVIIGEQTASSFGFLKYGTPDGSNRLSYSGVYTSEESLPATITDPEASKVWTLKEVLDGVFSMYSVEGKKFLLANSGLSFKNSDDTYTYFTVSAESNLFQFKVSSTYLGVNKGSNYWRDYASSTLTQTNCLALYKQDDTRTKLAAPEPIVVDNEIVWDPVSGAGSYTIKIGGKSKEGVTGTSYTFDNNDFSLEEAGYYPVKVVAVPADASLYRNSDDGLADGKVKFGTPKRATPVLAKGTVTSSAITVTWTADDFASAGYHCTISPADATAQDVTSGTVTFEGLNAETEYTITVTAKATTGDEALAASDSADIDVTTSSGAAKQYTLTVSSITYTGTNSYANCAGDRTYTAKASDNSETEVVLNFTDVMNGTGGNKGTLQFKKSTGKIVNKTDLGTINSITATGSFTIAIGPDSDHLSADGTGGYFSVNNNSGGALYSTVTIIFTK